MHARGQLHRMALPAVWLLAGCGAEVGPAALTTHDARPADTARADRAASEAGPDAGGEVGPTDAVASGDTAAAGDATADTSGPATTDATSDLGPGEAGDGAAALRCNGHAALCDRRFDQVVFPTTHNAMSNAALGFFGPNQPHRLRRQLDDGIRALLLDTHPWRGGAYLCHSACELGNQRLADGLGEIAGFLRANPHEVIALLIEDKLSPADTESAFAASGLTGLLHVQPAGAPWPTLRAMINDGRRLLVTAEHGRPPPAWYHHLWDLAWDTPYSFRNQGEFSCRLNRGKQDNALFLLNHWVENPLPSSFLSRDANRKDVLLARARKCQMESGKLPNFVAVNHYDLGDLLAVVRELNGL